MPGGRRSSPLRTAGDHGGIRTKRDFVHTGVTVSRGAAMSRRTATHRVPVAPSSPAVRSRESAGAGPGREAEGSGSDAARTATGGGGVVGALDATGARAAAAATITAGVATTTAAGEAAAAVESGGDDQTEGQNEELLHGGIPSQRWVRFHPVDGSPGDGGDGREGRRRDTTSLKTQQARLRKLE